MMHFVEKLERVHGDVANQLAGNTAPNKDRNGLGKRTFKMPSLASIGVYIFTGCISVLLACEAVNMGFVYEKNKPQLKFSRDSEQVMTRISGTNMKLSCVDMVTDMKNEAVKMRWLLDDVEIASQTKSDSVFSSGFSGPHADRLSHKSDVSKLGRLTVDRVREADQGVYSCETTGVSMLGYDKVNQKRWFRLNVVELEPTRYTGTVGVLSVALFTFITILVSLFETLFDDSKRNKLFSKEKSCDDEVTEAADLIPEVQETTAQESSADAPSTNLVRNVTITTVPLRDDSSETWTEDLLTEPEPKEPASTARVRSSKKAVVTKSNSSKKVASKKSLPRTKSKVSKKSSKRAVRSRSRRRL